MFVIINYSMIYFTVESFKAVRKNMKDLHHKSHFYRWFWNTIHIKFVDMCIIYFHTTFHMPSSNGPLIITTKTKAKYTFQAAATLLFYTLHKVTFNNSPTFF
jgi:hypothetical protein